MKKIYIKAQIASVLLLLGCVISTSNAQVSAYTFSQSITPYSAITGGTVLGSTGSDDQRFVDPSVPLGNQFTLTGPGFPVGFNFTFNGIVFDRLAINNNGWISLGQSSLTPSVDNATTSANGPLASTAINTPAYLRNRIGGLTKDLTGQTGSSLRLETIGTSPNQICVIQWEGYKTAPGSGDTLSFQIRLHQTTNVVEVHYSKIVFGGTPFSIAQVGLGGTTSADFNSRITTTDWNSTTAAVAANQGCNTQSGVTYPVNGRMFVWTPLAICTGIPSPGSASANINPACSGQDFVITVTGASNSGGVTHQWISSGDGINYTLVSGATDTILSTSLTASTYYRCVSACPSSGLSDTTSALQLMLKPANLCYCSTGLIGSCGAVNAEINHVNISTTSLNNNSGCNVIGGNAYIAFPDTGSATATLLKTVPYTFNVNCSAPAIVSVWIDYDQNGQFDANEWTQIALNAQNATGTVTVPISALTGRTGMRVRSRIASYPNGAGDACVNFSSGETEDYIITVGPAPACPNPPLAGIISGPTASCPGNSVSLTLSGHSLGTSLQWETSPDGTSWGVVAGAINPVFTTPAITDTVFYRVKVRCADSVYTTAFKITLNPFLNCYCNPDITDCSFDDDILNVNFAGINNTTSCAVDGYAHYPSPTASVNRGSSYPISVEVGPGGTEHVGVWIDYDHNGSFDASEFTAIGSANGATINSNIAVPIGASLGVTGMRVRLRNSIALTGIDQCAVYSDGETEDYLVNITVPPVCTIPPVGGTAAGPAAGEPGIDYLYIVTGSVGNIQWQGSVTSAAGPFFDIFGANDDSAVVNFSGTGSYWVRAYLTSPGCDPDSSNAVQVLVTLTGDNVCDAVNLSLGTNGPFTTNFASVEFGEPAPPAPTPPGDGCSLAGNWCNSNITNTLWFKFVAPVSGRVSIQSPGFDTQLALWDAAVCADILNGTATLIAANDDDINFAVHGGVQYSSMLDSVSCLTAGRTYYVQLDPRNPPGDSTVIVLTDLGGTSTPLNVSLNHKTDITCFGLSDGTIDMDVTGGSGNYSYLWNSGETTADISRLVGGSFTLTVTDPGCHASLSSGAITINEPDELIASLDSLVDVKCYGESTGGIHITILGGTGPFHFAWSNGATTQSLIGVSADSYIDTVIDHNGCILMPPPYPVGEPSVPLAVTLDSVLDNPCAGGHVGSVFITASGGTPGYNYHWSNGATTEDNTGLTMNVYDVSVHDANGCTLAPVSGTVGDGTAVITVTVDSVTNIRCRGVGAGAIYTTPGGGTGYSYLWSNSATTGDITNLSAGTYSLILTDSRGCTAANSASVTQPSSALAASSVSINQIQGGALGAINVTISGGTAPYHSLWNNNATSEDINNLVAGIYTCSITDAKGCSAVISDTVDLVSDIGSIEKVTAVNLFPNPTQERMFLELKLNEIANVFVEVFNINGQLIRQLSERNVLTVKFEMNFANEPAGVYYAKITVGETTQSRRIVVAR